MDNNKIVVEKISDDVACFSLDIDREQTARIGRLISLCMAGKDFNSAYEVLLEIFKKQ